MFLQKIRFVLLLILALCVTKELAAVPNWALLTPADIPSERRFASMAFDETSGKIILFGGVDSVTNFNDTWSWDGTTWTQLFPANSPSPRSEACMAFDQATGQLILFGGQNGSGAFGDTWSWDGTNWTQLTPANSPPARAVAAMAYDSATGQLILFGGENFINLFGDTWNWDGTTWTQLTPINSPSPRDAPSMAFDSATGQLILFGGFDGINQNDTWNWNGTNWTQLSPVNSPPGRFFASMDYDAATGQMILFGGQSGSTVFGDTWNWDGTNWTELTPTDSPPARSSASMAYDPATGQLILFGGFITSFGPLGDMWNWGIACPSTPDWTELTPALSPPARSGALMSFDQATGQLILFGGSDLTTIFNDTWNWNGNTWLQLSPANSPPARRQASMAYDPATGQLILFGGMGTNGFFNDTWVWDGTTWTQLFPANSPSPRTFGNFFFDSATGQMILFGGNDAHAFLQDTWIWDGAATNWVQLNLSTLPPVRTLSSMIFDPATGQLILFGGVNARGYLSDTWNWDGTTWTPLLPVTSPSARGGVSLAFDQATGQLVLFGGQDSNGKLNDTWNWNGTNWSQLSPSVAPSARSQAPMVFDLGTGQQILFGGLTSIGEVGDTWNWGIESLSPIATATPASQTICSGSTTSITLSANVVGTTFSWTVVENGVTGASAGSGNSIAQAISVTANAAGTATYTVTPALPTGCTGADITVIVTVNPLPDVSPTPLSQEICSGSTASIIFSSSDPNTTFSWTVVENGVTGASAGSGNSINQTLSITSPESTGTALYTITPTSLQGCTGPTVNAIVFVQPCGEQPNPPQHFFGKVKGHCHCHILGATHVLSWSHNLDPNVVGYRLYEEGILISVLPLDETHISIHYRYCHELYTYTLVTFNAEGIESTPVSLTL